MIVFSSLKDSFILLLQASLFWLHHIQYRWCFLWIFHTVKLLFMQWCNFDLFSSSVCCFPHPVFVSSLFLLSSFVDHTQISHVTLLYFQRFHSNFASFFSSFLKQDHLINTLSLCAFTLHHLVTKFLKSTGAETILENHLLMFCTRTCLHSECQKC